MKKEGMSTHRMDKRSLRFIMGGPDYREKMAQLENDDELSNLRINLKNLRRCFEKKLPPSSKGWPTYVIYREIVDSVNRLDPKRLERKKRSPFWRYALSSVNRRFPEVHLISTIESFVECASAQMPKEEMMPESLVALNAAVKKRSKKDHSDPGRKFQLFKIAFEIYNGTRKAKGENLAGLVDLSSNEFKKLCPAQLNAPSHIPKEWHPLVEYAAALEIVRKHQSFLGKNSSWLMEFSDFLRDLENSKYHKVEAQLALFNMSRDSKSRASQKTRQQATLRKRRQREREAKKK